VTKREPVISVVIAAYQESAGLGETLAAVQKELERVGEPWELILVDDGSSDNTWEIIREESRGQPAIRALRFSRNFGKEAALCAGMDICRGSAVITMDADLQHPPSLISDLIRTWRQTGANIVEAVKTEYVNESLLDRTRRKAFYVLLKWLSGFDLGGASDFKLMDRRVRAAWLKMSEKNIFFRGMIAWLGFKRAEVPFQVPERAAGTSQWSFLRLVGLAITGLTAFSAAPLRLATWVAVTFFVLAVLLSIYALVLKFAGMALSGFTTVIILQLVIGSLTFLVLGIMGEYLGRVYAEVKDRPRYIVADRIDHSTQPCDDHDEAV
jgi:polyisoprenyl-phosphate glycosyltransferase